MSGGKFSYFQRELIKQLVLESEVQRFTEEEMLAYVKTRLKQDVSVEHLYTVKRNLRRNSANQLNQMRKHKTAFIDELFFKRVNEIKKYQKELWRIYHTHTNDGHLQKDCIKEAHQLTVTLANMYAALPQISGLTFFTGGAYNGEKDLSSVLTNNSGSTNISKDSENPENYRPVV